MLGSVGVAERRGTIDGIHEHDRRLLAVDGGAHTLSVPGCVDASLDCGRDGRREFRRIRDEYRGRELVVLGLAHEVCGDEFGVGRRIRDHEDLGGTGLGVDAHDAADQSLGRRNVDVAGTGDDVHRIEIDARHAVRESADRPRATHRVNLIDAEQSGRTEDRRVHGTLERGLRRGGERDRADARDLRRHDVHDHARRVHRLAARARRSRRGRQAASAG